MFNVGVYVQQVALRNLRCSHTLAICAGVLFQHWMWGGEGVCVAIVTCHFAWKPVADCFPSTVPLHMVMHCTVAWARDRYVCPYNMRPRVSGLDLSLSSTFPLSAIYSWVWNKSKTFFVAEYPWALFAGNVPGAVLRPPTRCTRGRFQARESSWNHSRSESRLITLIPLNPISIPLKKQTNHTNLINLDSEREDWYRFNSLKTQD